MQVSQQWSDEDLIIELKNDNQQALSFLYRKHFPMIKNLIINNSGTDQDAKDVYQDAIIHFYEKIRDGKLELSCRIKTYIYSVSRRLWLKKLMVSSRFQGKIQDVEVYLEADDDIFEIEKKEKMFLQMEESLNSLGEPCRSILEDFYIKDYSMEQITDKFGYTNADNAKNQKYKCLQRLKKFFFAKQEEITE